jgi:hypothetical protein
VIEKYRVIGLEALLRDAANPRLERDDRVEQNEAVNVAGVPAPSAGADARDAQRSATSS